MLNSPIHSLTLTPVMSMDKSTTTRTAAESLEDSSHDEIVVTGYGRGIGMVTDKDILRNVGDASIVAENTILEDIMSHPLASINISGTLQDALDKMRLEKHPKLPVVNDDGQVLGMLYKETIIRKVDRAAKIAEAKKPFHKAVLGNLGFLLQFSGILLLVPALVATFLGDTMTATGIYLNVVLLLATGFFLNSYGEKSAMNIRQASVLVVSSLFLLSLFGTIPYLYTIPGTGGVVDTTLAAMPAERINDYEMFANAFFSSAAGFSTGGISLYDTPEDLPQSFTFYRSFTQLVGGMSFIYLVMTAFYTDRKLESLQNFVSRDKGYMRELFVVITIIFTLYIMVTAMLLYLLGDDNLLDDFSLAMSTLATGGFLPHSGMLEDMGWQKQLVLIAAMILGSLPFAFHHSLTRKKFRRFELGREVMAYMGLLAGAVILLVWIDDGYSLESVFHAVSASTTAGLELSSLSQVHPVGLYIIMVLMLVGGCGFSTAGGIKVFRLLQLSDVSGRLLRRQWGFSSAYRKDVISALIVTASFVGVAILAAMYLAEVEGVEMDAALFDGVGIITTGGLSVGVINFESQPHTKILLSVLMIVGRLEMIALVYIIVPALGVRYQGTDHND